MSSLPLNILRMDMPCGSRVQGNQISPCKSATLVSYSEANFIVFSTPCSQQTIHPTSEAYQNIMSPSSPTCWIIWTHVFLVVIIIVLRGLAWKLTQAIDLDNFDFHPKRFIADILSVQTTFQRLSFRIKGFNEPQYYPYQLLLDVKTLLHGAILSDG